MDISTDCRIFFIVILFLDSFVLPQFSGCNLRCFVSEEQIKNQIAAL